MTSFKWLGDDAKALHELKKQSKILRRFKSLIIEDSEIDALSIPKQKKEVL